MSEEKSQHSNPNNGEKKIYWGEQPNGSYFEEPVTLLARDMRGLTHGEQDKLDDYEMKCSDGSTTPPDNISNGPPPTPRIPHRFLRSRPRISYSGPDGDPTQLLGASRGFALFNSGQLLSRAADDTQQPPQQNAEEAPCQTNEDSSPKPT